MKNSECDPNGPEQIQVEHDGKTYVFSHVNNSFFPTFAFLKDVTTDQTITVLWADLKEEERSKISDHLRLSQQGQEEAPKNYDTALYDALMAAPYEVRQALRKQAEETARQFIVLGTFDGKRIDSTDDKVPEDLLEEVALGIAKAKKEQKKYERTFKPGIQKLITDWLTGLGLNPQKSYDMISVDFSG